MYQMAAQAALSIYGAAQAAKAQAEEDLANNVAQANKRKLEFNRDTQAFMQNTNALNKQDTSNNFNIGLAAAEAEDQLALASAGSGLGGSSINELDTEISRSVGADKVSAHRQLLDGQDALNRERINANENRTMDADQSRAHDYSSGITNAIMSGAAPMVGKFIGDQVTERRKEEDREQKRQEAVKRQSLGKPSSAAYIK